jgi:hypothetical protein
MSTWSSISVASAGQPAGDAQSAAVDVEFTQDRIPRISISGWIACIVLLLAFMGTQTPGTAAFEWEKTLVELTAAPRQDVVSASFPFRNGSRGTQEILSVVPGCDCVAAHAAKRTYAPGERGEVRVEFTIGDRVGRQERKIGVITDDAPGEPRFLTLIVTIPEPVAIQPRFLFWKVGEASEEKSFEIRLLDPGTTTLGAVQCTSPDFAVRLETTGQPGLFRLCARPVTASKPVQVTVRVNAVVADRPEVVVLYLLVK